jgi:putative ABC transport system ATP-binding protein
VTPFVEARDVGKRFHAGTDAEVRAVDGVSLVAPRGSFVLLTGPSGSGKTTLIALLGTLERPTSGAVLVDGADVAALTEAARSRLRRRFGFAFPGGPMIPALPLWENVTLGLVPGGVGVAARRRIAAEFLDRVGLASKLRARPEELSTGELNRATLARALAGTPEAIFADEPLASLDAAAQRLVDAALSEAHRGGATLLVASHVAEPFAFATASCRLEGGRRIDTEGRVTP